MKIVGFAQTVRIDGSAKEGFEIKVRLDDGTETSVPTSQETITALTELWAAGSKKPKATYAPREESFMPPPPSLEEDESLDEGEVFGGNVIPPVHVEADEMGYPKTAVLDAQEIATPPRPRFLESDDEDGQQV